MFSANLTCVEKACMMCTSKASFIYLSKLMRFSRKRGFTLWEILIIVIVISVGLLAIISLLTYGINYVQKSRQKIISINLAREGIEAMYQIRDTNRQRWAGMKESCRLKTNPLVDEMTA